MKFLSRIKDLQPEYKMKVLHVINTLSAGGAELHLLTLCRHQKVRGIEIVVACLRERVKGSRSLRDDFENAGIRVIALEANGRYDLRSISRLAGLVAKERPSILHSHLPRADLAALFRGVCGPSLPWVCSVHDIHDKSWSGRWTLPLFNFVWRRADRVIAISHAVKNWLATERSVPSARISVIHYGIDAEPFWRPEADLREQWGLQGKSIIGAIGRLEPRKGHDCLIRSMLEIRQAIPDAVLVIAGHDPWGYGDKLQGLIDSLALSQEVRLIGFQRDITSFLSALDVFAFATHSEGFGQVIIEAMAAGKPSVVSKVAPLTEIVVDGDTGLFAKPADPQEFANAIVRLLNDSELGQRMGRRAQERVQSHFSARRMVEETINIYDDLIKMNQLSKSPPRRGQEFQNYV